MKKIKKLTLNKEEIINLNNFEMNASKGGNTTTTTTTVTPIITPITISPVSIVDNYGQEQSYWNCPASQDPNCMSDVSENIVWYTSVGACELPEIVVYGN